MIVQFAVDYLMLLVYECRLDLVLDVGLILDLVFASLDVVVKLFGDLCLLNWIVLCCLIVLVPLLNLRAFDYK